MTSEDYERSRKELYAQACRFEKERDQAREELDEARERLSAIAGELYASGFLGETVLDQLGAALARLAAYQDVATVARCLIHQWHNPHSYDANSRSRNCDALERAVAALPTPPAEKAADVSRESDGPIARALRIACSVRGAPPGETCPSFNNGVHGRRIKEQREAAPVAQPAAVEPAAEQAGGECRACDPALGHCAGCPRCRGTGRIEPDAGGKEE
jgi:hypothetical protein